MKNEAHLKISNVHDW